MLINFSLTNYILNPIRVYCIVLHYQHSVPTSYSLTLFYEKWQHLNKCKNWKSPKLPIIWEIPQIPGNLGNSLNSLENLRMIFFNYRTFLKWLAFWEFPKTCESGEFPKYPDIWGIPQISSHLGNFQNLKNIPPLKFLKEFGISGEFPKYNLGNFPNIWESGGFSKFLFSSEVLLLSGHVFNQLQDLKFKEERIWGISKINQIFSFHFKYIKITV